MFDIKTTSPEVSLLNYAVSLMQRAITRVASLSDNFSIPYQDLPENCKPFAAMIVSEYNIATAILKKLDAISIGNSLQNLNPQAVIYIDDIFFQAQVPVVTDPALDKKLTEGFQHAHSWKNHTCSSVKLEELDMQLNKQPETNPAGTPDTAADQQDAAA